MSELAAFKKALKGNNFCVLDTETSGLDKAEIVQIAIIDSVYPQPLLNTLVKPVRPIPPSATAIHGITDEMCKDAPSWIDLAPKIKTILEGKLLVVYNANYDRKMFHQTAERHGLPKTEWKEICEWHCAMNAFSEFYGEWNDYHGNYRWQKLVTAAAHCGVTIADAHSALGDCYMALAVTKHMLKEADNEADGGDDETD